MEELRKYYTNLLILQYKNKPKAKATIEALVNNTFAGTDQTTKDGIFPLQVEYSYDVDKASGVQLDVIGKYLGIDRKLKFVVDENFSYQDCYDSTITGNGYADCYNVSVTKPYKDAYYSTYTEYQLVDELFKKVLKFWTFIKNEDMSYYAISEGLYQAFGDDLYVVEGDKALIYHFGPNAHTFENDAQRNEFIAKYMPHPMGVVVTQVKDEESSSI